MEIVGALADGSARAEMADIADRVVLVDLYPEDAVDLPVDLPVDLVERVQEDLDLVVVVVALVRLRLGRRGGCWLTASIKGP